MNKYANVDRLKALIKKTYLPSDSLTAGVLYDLLSMAQREDVAPVQHSRWVEESDLYVYCESCRAIEHHNDKNYKSKFCPCCGATMDGTSYEN